MWGKLDEKTGKGCKEFYYTPHGDPIVITHPDSPAAEAITELAKTIDARPRGLVGINLGVQPVSH